MVLLYDLSALLATVVLSIVSVRGFRLAFTDKSCNTNVLFVAAGCAIGGLSYLAIRLYETVTGTVLSPTAFVVASLLTLWGLLLAGTFAVFYVARRLDRKQPG